MGRFMRACRAMRQSRWCAESHRLPGVFKDHYDDQNWRCCLLRSKASIHLLAQAGEAVGSATDKYGQLCTVWGGPCRGSSKLGSCLLKCIDWLSSSVSLLRAASWQCQWQAAQMLTCLVQAGEAAGSDSEICGQL